MKVKVTVDNRLRMEIAEMPAELVERLREDTSHSNPDFHKKQRMGFSVRGIPRQIETWREYMGEFSLPRGCTEVLRRACSDLFVIPVFEDARNPGMEVTHGLPRRPLFPHQVEAVDAIAARQNMILRSATGSGKTSAMIGSFHRLRTPCLVIVHSIELANQWIERLEVDLGMSRDEVGIIQGGKVKLRPVTVAMQKTLYNVLEKGKAEAKQILQYFGAVFADEVHFFAASTFFDVIDPFPAKYRVGASADHKRKDRKDFLVSDLFGEVAIDQSHADLVAIGRVLPVETRIIETAFHAHWYVQQQENMAQGIPDFSGKTHTTLIQEMEVDEFRENAWWPVLEEELRTGEQVFILAHHREHCQRIAARLASQHVRAGLMLGSPESRDEFRESKAGMLAGRIQVGVGTYKAIGTGIDVPRVGVGFAVTPIGSNKQFVGQVRGRLCRVAEGKTFARLYQVLDPLVFGISHHRNLRGWFGSPLVRVGSEWKEWEE